MQTITLKKPDPKKAEEYFSAKCEFTTGPVELWHMIKENPKEFKVIDVRAEEDYKKEHIPGAYNLPRGKWETFDVLSKDLPNILYCYSQTCHLAAKAGKLFASKGYPVMEMEGGFEAWKERELETEKKENTSCH